MKRTHRLPQSNADSFMPKAWRWLPPAAVCCTFAVGCEMNRGPFALFAFDETRELGPSPWRELTVPDRLAVRPQNEDAIHDIGLESPLVLSVERAVLLALRNNRALRVQQLQPMIVATFEELERAQFDPSLSAEISTAHGNRRVFSTTSGPSPHIRSEQQSGDIAVQQALPSGTGIAISFGADRFDADRLDDLYQIGPAITLTQALLRGANWEANIAAINQARIDTQVSEYELRGFAEALVAEVEATFWEYLFTDQEIKIFESSLELAEQQLAETRRRVEVGTVAATELAASRAEVAQRYEALINARSNKRRLHLRILRLINPDVREGWDVDVMIEGEAEVRPLPLSPVAEHVQLAERLRPELNEARLLLERGRLEVRRTRDGLLPRLDLFISLGKTGYARSFSGAWDDLDGRGYDFRAGLLFSQPLGNRAANATHQRARLARRQAGESLHNLRQLVSLDVREAHLEVERAQEQIEATRATRELREETLRAESEKFRVGNSTAFLVAQAQRDLLESQIAELRAIVNYRQALIMLYRFDGTLLLRRAIAAPGAATHITDTLFLD